jgi:hypothetical protein
MVRLLLAGLVAVACGGCAWDAPPVEFDAPTPLSTATDSTMSFVARWARGSSPEVVINSARPQPERPETAVAECPGSRVESAVVGGLVWSAWWRIRPDSSAVLMSDARDAAGRIQRTIAVDSVDVARLGCARPAPAIVVDSLNGYVHVSYFMVAPEGPGLFYVHLMNPAASRFELPVAVVYGEKPVATALASRGDTVAVVYEDPNSERGRIAMSLSLTAGHLFEQTARIVPVSTSSQQASAPTVVRLSGRQLWIGWKESSASGAAFLLRRARIVSR